jgi:hypothetical protein
MSELPMTEPVVFGLQSYMQVNNNPTVVLLLVNISSLGLIS